MYNNCIKTMVTHNLKLKKQIINRLASIAGHAQGIKKMVDEDQSCMDIIKQIQAVQSALDKVSENILEDHLNTCVSNAMKKGKGQKYIKEIMEIVKHQKK